MILSANDDDKYAIFNAIHSNKQMYEAFSGCSFGHV